MTVEGLESLGGIPGKFSHPYEPYDIQLLLMQKIYDTIDSGCKVGLFESPTGTGKTLSVICSSMTWLRKEKNRPQVVDEDSDSEPEWVQQSYMEKIQSQSKQKLRDYELHLDQIQTQVHQLPEKRVKLQIQDEYLPEDYHSDSEVADVNEQLKLEINRLLNKEKGMDLELDENSPRIFFSSRTHTQLTQFSDQLRMTSFESSIGDLTERIKYLPLGSRKQLCIHPRVSKLSTTDAVNEACRDLTTLEKKCDYLQNMNGLKAEFSDHSVAKIHDIEDLKQLGSYMKVCPYYSVRDGIKVTEIVSLPYQMLLEENTRQVLNVNLKDSVIIIDEAHNLFDTINSMNSVSITKKDIDLLKASLKFYLNRFLKRLNSGNRVNLMKLVKICTIISDFISRSEATKSIKTGVQIKPDDLFQSNTGDLFNIHKLSTYLSKSKIAFKIETYLEKNYEEYTKTSSPLLFKLTRFLKSLNNPSKEGKFFWNNSEPNNPAISYMLLDPSEIFKPIVEQCRSLILCGGTMEPMSDYTEYLFPYLSSDQITKFSCDHIIPDSNLKAIPIGSFSGKTLDFSFKHRNDKMLIKTLGSCLGELVSTVPDGVVIFFPSYKYLNQVVDEWKKCGTFQALCALKLSVFIEPNSSGDVEKVLGEYTDSIKLSKGAILLAVVGGKLSEGINFLDELARAVIMIGLPYPNLMSGELIAKKDFIESKTLAKTGSREQALQNGRDFIENICMRAINQSIGRSIRHIKDYSMIFFIDQRYNDRRIQLKLSGWISRRVLNGLQFGDVLEHTNEFFMTKSIMTPAGS